MTKSHVHKFDQRVKRKVQLSQFGATTRNPHPEGSLVGYDYLLLWRCSCGQAQAYDLIREAM